MEQLFCNTINYFAIKASGIQYFPMAFVQITLLRTTSYPYKAQLEQSVMFSIGSFLEIILNFQHCLPFQAVPDAPRAWPVRCWS